MHPWNKNDQFLKEVHIYEKYRYFPQGDDFNILLFIVMPPSNK